MHRRFWARFGSGMRGWRGNERVGAEFEISNLRFKINTAPSRTVKGVEDSMRFLRRFIFAFFAVAMLPVAVCRADVSLEQMKGESRGCRERAGEAIQTYESMAARWGEQANFVRRDLASAKPVYNAAIEAWRETADAYDELDPTGATAPRAAAEKADQDCRAWRERMELRDKQLSAFPSEGYCDQLRANSGPTGIAALGAMIEAQKAASEGWGMAADSMLPHADREKIAVLLESAQRLAGEVDLASAAFNAVDRRERLAREAGADSPKIVEALAALGKLDEERASLHREELARAARLRDLDRRRAALEEQIHQLNEAAKSAATK